MAHLLEIELADERGVLGRLVRSEMCQQTPVCTAGHLAIDDQSTTSEARLDEHLTGGALRVEVASEQAAISAGSSPAPRAGSLGVVRRACATAMRSVHGG